MNILQIGIEEAVRVASRSTHKRYLMGAVVIKNDKEIVAKGWQHSGTWRMRELYSMHAELHCLFKLRHMRGKLEGHKIYVAGIARKSGNFVHSAPCLRCAISLYQSGFDSVVYTVPRSPSIANLYNVHEFNLAECLDDLKKYPAPNG